MHSGSGRKTAGLAVIVAAGCLAVASGAGAEVSDSERRFLDRGIDLAAEVRANTHPVYPAGDGPRPRIVASCLGVAATISGTAAGETIIGTAGDDVIQALGGADTVNGGGGTDTICGGGGNDKLNGESGDEYLIGEGGNDILRGGDGGSIVIGDFAETSGGLENRTPGKDRLFPGTTGGSMTLSVGDNFIQGANTVVRGGAADRIVLASGVATFVVGDSMSSGGSEARGGGADRIEMGASAGVTALIGDSAATLGDDSSAFGGGADEIVGGIGSGGAVIAVGDSAGRAAASGFGRDVIRMRVDQFIVGDSLGEGGTASGGGRDKLTAVAAGLTPDVFGDSLGATNATGGGQDRISMGGTGRAVGDSAATQVGGTARGGGSDSIRAMSGGEVVGDSLAEQGDATGGGKDRIAVGGTPAGDRQVIGDSRAGGTARGGGRDFIRGGGTRDKVYADSLAINGNALLSGSDTVLTGGGPDFVSGDSFSDLGIATGSGSDLIRGGPGDDDLLGDHPGAADSGAGRDKIYGEAGIDFLDGGPLRDLCDGGTGSPDTQTACEIRIRIP